MMLAADDGREIVAALMPDKELKFGSKMRSDRDKNPFRIRNCRKIIEKSF